MAIKCIFEFERSSPIFYSCENICGHVTITTKKHLKIKALTLYLLGTYQVQWNEKYVAVLDFPDGEERLSMPEMNYAANKVLFNIPYLLTEKCILTPGSHDFSFNFTCPPKIAATIRHSLAEVAYKLQLNVHKNNNKFKRFYQRVIIKSTLDLNVYGLQKQQENFTLAAQQLEIFLPQTTFVPGQLIRYNLRYKRMCLTKAHEIKVCLVQKLIFNSLNESVKNKQISQLIAHTKWKMIDAEQYLQLPLTIPASTTASNSMTTNWPIHISYTFEIVAVDYKNNVIDRVNWPIIIGTITHRRTYYLNNEIMGPYCFDNFAVAVEKDEKVIKHNFWTAAVIESDVDSMLDKTTKSMFNFERLSLLA